MLEIEWANETWTLLPERVLFRPRRRTLFVADPHFGKDAAFRVAGVPVPRGPVENDIARLESAVARTGAERLVILGDLLHARTGRTPETLGALASFRTAHTALATLLVRGNHDRRAGDPPHDLAIEIVDEPWVEDGVALCHDPAAAPDDHPALAGHVHPGVRLRDRHGGGARLPCFRFTERLGILPAFGSFTGLAIHARTPGTRLFVVVGDTIVGVPGGAIEV